MRPTTQHGVAAVVVLAAHVGVLYWNWPRPITRVLPTVTYITARVGAVAMSLAPLPAPAPPTAPPSSPSPVTASNPSIKKPDFAKAEIARPKTTHLPPSPTPIDPAPWEEPNQTASPPVLDGYFAFDAVDPPAIPFGDWFVHTEVLPRFSSIRAEIWIWISASGQIDRWELAPGSEPYDLLMRALSELDLTRLSPAMRNNLAVPSFRRIEIVVSRE